MANTLTITFIFYSTLAAALVPYAFGRNIITTHVEEAPPIEKWLNNVNLAEKMKLTKLQFYFHDIVSGQNKSVYNITDSVTPNSDTWFGRIQVVDHLLTDGPKLNSEKVGRVQGMHVLSDLHEPALGVNWNFIFNDGSTISVLGRLVAKADVGELSIVGGTRKYLMARGIVIKKTFESDPATLNSIFVYTMYVYTPSPVGLMSLL